jgi:hypothetical protein
VVVLAVLLGATSCIGPARTRSDFRLKTRNSAKSVASALATAQLGSRLVRDEDAFANYLGVLFDSADRDASSVESTYASIQPPDDASMALRDRFSKVLTDATDTLSTMRIAARRHAWNDLLDASHDIPRLQRRLRRYQELPA